MVDKRVLREVVTEQYDNLNKVEDCIERDVINSFIEYIKLPHIIVISGLRRVGKSTLLKQIINRFYRESSFYFIDFEDERLIDFESTDFNKLKEVFIELFGEVNTYFFDEVQNVQGWDRFVRRLYDSGAKIYLTGSNASLLEKDISSKLTGRYLYIELLPFSFNEYLRMEGKEVEKNWYIRTEKRAEIKSFFDGYLTEGGMPEFLRYNKDEILQRLYKDVIFRDIVARYHIRNVKGLRDLSLYLISNLSSLFTYSSLQKATDISNINSVKEYVSYLEDSFMIFVIKGYGYSLKEQVLNPKKAYVIDSGMRRIVGFSFSADRGKYLENIVFLELRRRGKELFYYKTKSSKEIDFFVHHEKEPHSLIQVSTSLHEKEVKEREIRALKEGMQELELNEGVVITEDEDSTIKVKEGTIRVIPITKWLLSS